MLGDWRGKRRRRADARAAVKDARSTLEQQAGELVEAVLALGVSGKMHDQLWAGWGPRKRLAMLALINGGIGIGLSDRIGLKKIWDGYDRMVDPITAGDRDATVAAEKLSAPLNRLVAAMPPLLRRGEEPLRSAATVLFETALAHSQGGPELERALSAFHDALRAVLDPPPDARRSWRRLGRRPATAELTAPQR